MTSIAAVTPFARRPRRGHVEDAIQAGIVAFLRAALPAGMFRVLAVPNGGARTKAEASRMKATGTLAGVWDVCILGPGGGSFWLEVKTDDGALSKEQRDMRDFMVAAQVPHALVRSIDQAEAAVRSWGLPLRGRVA